MKFRNPLKPIVVALLAGLLLAAPFAGPCIGAETASERSAPLQEAFKSLSGAPWKIDAAQISYDFEQRVYEAQGNVRITSEDRSIEADHAILNTERQQVELRGNVHLRYGRNWLKGEHVVWNLNHETGVVTDGIIYFSDNNFYAQGKSIAKLGPNNYELKDGVLTSCDPENPDWSVRYKEMNINTQGTAWVKHSSFWIRSLPVFYTPVAAVPALQRRQSGFLIPWAGFSDLMGFEAELPFYWAIREDMDATLYGRYMERRGWMTGLEYRIANKKWGEGAWLFHYLRDEATPEFLASRGFSFEGDDRFWLRGRHTLDLPNEFKARLDVDIVSDRNFLLEFNRGSSSYLATHRMFLDFMGRGFVFDDRSPIRESNLLVDRRWESSLLSLDVHYWDNLVEPLDKQTLQRFPALSYNIIPSHVGDSPLYYTLDSSFVNYWRREGDRAGRLNVTPRIHYPLHWGNYLDLEPSVGLLSSAYAVDWEQDSRGNFQGKLLPDFRLEMSSRLNRVYDFELGDVVAIQHSIRPEIVYENAPDEIEGDFPRFDRLDERGARHGISYGVSNFIMAKEVTKDAHGNQVTSFREVARMRLFQEYNFEVSPQTNLFGPTPDEGFSAIGMRLDITPRKYVTLSYDTDLYSSGSSSAFHDFFVTLETGRGDFLRVDYQFRDDIPVNELITNLVVKVLPNLYVNTYHDYSIRQEELLKHGYGLRYMHGCWGFGLAFEKEAKDERVAVSVNLLGLGAFGSKFNYGGPESSTALR